MITWSVQSACKPCESLTQAIEYYARLPDLSAVVGVRAPEEDTIQTYANSAACLSLTSQLHGQDTDRTKGVMGLE